MRAAVAYAGWHGKMAAPQPDGRPLREHLTHAAKHVASLAAELVPPVLPAACRQVWGWWTELAHARPQSGLGGLGPLPYSELAAWATLTGRVVAPIEVEALQAMDAAWRQGVSEGTPKRTEG